MMIKKVLRAGVVSALLLSSGSSAALAQVSLLERELANPQAAAKADLGFRRGSVIVAPIPFSNPMIGSGLTLGAGYLFTLPGSKPSGAGLAKLKSSNGSEGLGGGFSLSFADGGWSVSLFAAEATLFYDFPLGSSVNIPIKQTGEAYALRVDRGISESLSAGVSFTYLDSTIGIDSPGLGVLPPILRPDADLSLGKVGLDVTFDTRDDTFYPTEGTLVAASLSYGVEVDSIFGGNFKVLDRSYTKGLLSAAHYREVGESGVLAAKASLCGLAYSAPFFDACGVGLANGLRGFGALDDLEPWSAAVQAEYRGRLSNRFGYVVFAGFGGGGESLGSMSFDSGGFAAGVGLRVRVSRKFGLDYAIDYARNDDQEDFLYVTLGQRF
ncbi:outer membrane protein assembly factor [Defluviimonas sp. WL0075]|uniref:Outer membrane protein assembly factor n=1 Tax=Albidovulum sediminicola TaxID=2984331 RepID=A0ABT2Z738_9RHOB|nr:outer membrane protein assembly factor [Defluviimonas sp. WL0075]MCV2866954.1 outer membrane protein assembly factor [Defluviimonas sp. WL0075]